MKKVLISLVAILLLCGSLAGCTQALTPPPIIPSNVSFAADYDSIFDALKEAQCNNPYRYYGPGFVTVTFASESSDSAARYMPANSPPSNVIGGSETDHSGTNVQVEGIDEGDIVKTDGIYIYSLRDGKLSIFKADGANTRLISTTEVVKPPSEQPATIYNDMAYDYTYENATEMYLCGKYAVVITQFNHSEHRYEPYSYKYDQISKTYIYDVSNPASPALAYNLGQDGYILTSRMVGNTLYLLSSHSVYSIEEDAPETFVPALYTNDEKRLIAPDCIAIMPYINSTTYTVVSTIDVPSGKVSTNQTLLGGGSVVYMSAQNIYITSYEYKSVESTRDYGIYTVVDYLNYTLTNITRLDISNGNVKVAAYGSIPGSLGNQFYMDEYNGYLRVVTTDDSYKYSITTDAFFGTTDYKWGDAGSSNGLYILDMALNCVGSVENLAQGERVYSVRFDGNIGYFVTFRTVDPLFAVDLSNPQKPVVLSALKIPGFSQYLHVYADGLLFGLGYSADETTGWRESMKISMFDTSDPRNVTEAHTLLLNSYYSTALYNHKAILIDQGKNIIGFPAGSEYLVYGYDNQTGFFRRASINLNGNLWDKYGWEDSRGLYISEFFYVVSGNSIGIIDMKNFNLVKTVSYTD